MMWSGLYRLLAPGRKGQLPRSSQIPLLQLGGRVDKTRNSNKEFAATANSATFCIERNYRRKLVQFRWHGVKMV